LPISRRHFIATTVATVFRIDTGTIAGRLVAPDGHRIEPTSGRRSGFAMGQRPGIELDLPAGNGACRILPLRAGDCERTGLLPSPPARACSGAPIGAERSRTG